MHFQFFFNKRSWFQCFEKIKDNFREHMIKVPLKGHFRSQIPILVQAVMAILVHFSAQ